MAKYIGTILTNKGKELLARAILGEEITFTKVEIGKGVISDGTNKEELISLVETFKTLSITSTTVLEGGGYRIRVAFNNSGIIEDTYLKEIGIFARGEDGVEMLYSYCDTDTPDIIPSESSGVLERVEDVITYISSAGTINAVIDQSNVYATIKDLVEGLATKEDKFAKNDAFNKIFGTGNENIPRGNHVHSFDEITGCQYKVGDYLHTENAAHPATRWIGTTWAKLEGRVLLGTSSGYALGTEGGSSTVTLSKANLPNIKLSTDSHLHTQPGHTHIYQSYTGGSGYGGSLDRGQVAQTTSAAGGENTGAAAPMTEALGSGTAFNIMNPHRAVNIWRRTA